MTDNITSNIREFFDKTAETWDDYSFEDSALIEEYIKLLDLQHGDKIIDLACGTGVVTKQLEKTCASEILAIDISKKMIDIAQDKVKSPKVEFIVADFLDCEIEKYNCLIMYNALPHFTDRNKLAQCISNAVGTGGKVLICHGVGKNKINSCHKNVMHISSHLHSPSEEFKNFEPDFKMIESRDGENSYYFLMEKI